MGILSFGLALLYAISEPTKLRLLIILLFWIYLLSGILFLFGAQFLARVFSRSFTNIALPEKKTILYVDCAFRTVIGILLIYAI
jgi:hypothetical protein